VAVALESIIDGIIAFCNYSVQKELYLSDCQIRDKLNEYRQAIFSAAVQKQYVATVELARCKCRLELLKTQCNNLPEPVRPLLLPLLHDLDNRIFELREQRRSLR